MDMDMTAYRLEWKRVIWEERKLLEEKKKTIFTEHTDKLRNFSDETKEKIPPKVLESLENGFYQGFLLIFSKGTDIVEKTIAKGQIQREFKVKDMCIDHMPDQETFQELHKGNVQKNLLNSCITTVEGVGLGALGIGLPDIPIFLAMMMRGVYETALGYGFSFDTEWEQVYILKMIRCAMSSGEEKVRLNKEVDGFLKQKAYPVYDFKEEVKQTASSLSEVMVVGKFVQGMFLVGAVGGLANPVIYNRIMQYVAVKYKKRYLIGKIFGV